MASVASIRSQSLTTRELLAGIKVIDVDTHVSEWPDLWTSRASAKWKNLVPRMVGEGEEKQWVIGENQFLAARNAVSAIRKTVGADQAVIQSTSEGYRMADNLLLRRLVPAE